MAFTHSITGQHFMADHKITSPAEQKLKLEERAAWLKQMIASSENDRLAKRNFEQDLIELRKLYASIVPDDVIQARCERLATLRQSLNIRITDNRSAYRVRNAQAVANEVAKLCGGAA